MFEHTAVASALLGTDRTETELNRRSQKCGKIRFFYKINDTKSWRLTFKRNSFLTIFTDLVFC